MSFRRMLPFLLLNVVVSATVVLTILWWWDGRNREAEPASPLAAATLPAVGINPDPASPDTAVDTTQPDDTAVASGSADENPVHVVAAGDTLGRISEQYEVSIDAIMTANGLSNPNLLSVGQQLIIPVNGMPEAPTEAPPAAATADDGTPPTPIPTVAAVAGEADVTIAQVAASGDLAGENVQIVNNGSSDAALQGWQLVDAQGSAYTFGQVTLFGAGAGITVHTRSGQDTATDLFWGNQTAVWQSGETVTLLDASGTPRATFTVP